jgi:peroxiredoxin (alkyl hydroperoxide reductase subunit C)
MTLKVGQRAPDFSLPSHLGQEIQLKNYLGKNLVLAFFPLAWTPVCTNQIPSYQDLLSTFEAENTQVLGISVDHVPCLQAWAESLGGISFPLLSDFWPHGKVAELFGILRSDGRSERAVFVMDTDGVIRDIDIHDINDQPNNTELFDILRQLNGKQGMQSTQSAEPLPSGGIVMYCTRWCPDCRSAREWLAYHNLAYKEVDVNANPQAAAYIRQLAGGKMITPTFDIDGQYVFDFDEEKLKEILL